MVAEVYRSTYEKADTPAENRDVAVQMFQQALATDDDSAGKFVMLRIARDIAAEAGEADLAMCVIDEIARCYQLADDEAGQRRACLAMKLATLRRASTAAVARRNREDVVQRALAYADEARSALWFDLAREFVALAVDAAQETRDRVQIHRASRTAEVLNATAAAFQAIAEDAELLEVSPTDAAAKRSVGMFYCFHAGDWEAGLPMLAECDTPELRRLAALELQASSDVERRVELGDGWWLLAQTQEGLSRANVLRRALGRYEKALPDTQGLTRDKIAVRIARAGKELAPQVRYLADLAPSTVVVNGSPSEAGVRIRQPCSVRGEEILHGLRLHPPGPKTSSHAAYQLDGHYGELSGSVGIADGIPAPRSATPLVFRILGDGKRLWRSRPISARGDAQLFRVRVGAIRKLELFVDCPGPHRNAVAVWVDPILEK